MGKKRGVKARPSLNSVLREVGATQEGGNCRVKDAASGPVLCTVQQALDPQRCTQPVHSAPATTKGQRAATRPQHDKRSEGSNDKRSEGSNTATTTRGQRAATRPQRQEVKGQLHGHNKRSEGSYTATTRGQRAATRPAPRSHAEASSWGGFGVCVGGWWGVRGGGGGWERAGTPTEAAPFAISRFKHSAVVQHNLLPLVILRLPPGHL